MATTNINVRVDTKLKEMAEALFNDLGLNMSTAITMFLKATIKNNGIPFELKRHIPNTKTIKALEEFEQMKKNPNKYKRYRSFKNLVDEVLSND